MRWDALDEAARCEIGDRPDGGLGGEVGSYVANHRNKNKERDRSKT